MYVSGLQVFHNRGMGESPPPTPPAENLLIPSTWENHSTK